MQCLNVSNMHVLVLQIGASVVCIYWNSGDDV